MDMNDAKKKIFVEGCKWKEKEMKEQIVSLNDVLVGKAKTKPMSITITATFPSFEIRDNGTYLQEAIEQAVKECIINEAERSDIFDYSMLHVPNVIKIKIES